MCFAPAAQGDSTHSHTPLHVYPDLTFNKYLNLPHFQILSLRTHLGPLHPSHLLPSTPHHLSISHPLLLFYFLPSAILILPLPLFFCLALRGSSSHASQEMQSRKTSFSNTAIFTKAINIL